MNDQLRDRLITFTSDLLRDAARDMRRQVDDARPAMAGVTDPLARAYAEGVVAGSEGAAEWLEQWADNIIAGRLVADLDGNDA